MSLACVCVWIKLLLPPNIWFSPLEKLDEMSGFAFWPRHHVFIQGFTRPREKLAEDLLIKTLLIRTLKTFLTKVGSCKANSSPLSISHSKAKHTFFMTIKLIMPSFKKDMKIHERGDILHKINLAALSEVDEEGMVPFYKFQGWYVLLAHLGSSISVFRRGALFVPSKAPSLPSSCQFWPHSATTRKDIEKGEYLL